MAVLRLLSCGVIFAVCGLTVSWVIAGLWLGRASRGWPVVPGVLDSVHYKQGRAVTVHVRYRFRVGDRELTGTTYRIGDVFGSSPTRPTDAPEMQPGAAIEVRHHPTSPRWSTVATGTSPLALYTALVTLFFGVAFTLGSARFLVSALL